MGFLASYNPPTGVRSHWLNQESIARHISVSVSRAHLVQVLSDRVKQFLVYMPAHPSLLPLLSWWHFPLTVASDLSCVRVWPVILYTHKTSQWKRAKSVMCTVNILEDAQQENAGLGLPLCFNEHNILPGIASSAGKFANSQNSSYPMLKDAVTHTHLHTGQSILTGDWNPGQLLSCLFFCVAEKTKPILSPLSCH